jgi:hypothetical protein
MRAILIACVTALMACPSPAAAQGAPDWKETVAALPALTSVAVQFRDGRKLSGTIVGVRDDGFELQRRTRYPETPRFVLYTEVAAIERRPPGLSSGAKATLGAASVVTTLLVLTIAYLSQID